MSPKYQEDAFDLIKKGDDTSKLERLDLDLTAANMIDSAGLNLLVALVRLMEERRGSVNAKISSVNIQRTFSFTRLDKHLTVKMV